MNTTAVVKLQTAARAIRVATHALDDAAWAAPGLARKYDGIQGVEFIQLALAEQIEALIEALIEAETARPLMAAE